MSKLLFWAKGLKRRFLIFKLSIFIQLSVPICTSFLKIRKLMQLGMVVSSSNMWTISSLPQRRHHSVQHKIAYLTSVSDQKNSRYLGIDSIRGRPQDLPNSIIKMTKYLWTNRGGVKICYCILLSTPSLLNLNYRSLSRHQDLYAKLAKFLWLFWLIAKDWHVCDNTLSPSPSVVDRQFISVFVQMATSSRI